MKPIGPVRTGVLEGVVDIHAVYSIALHIVRLRCQGGANCVQHGTGAAVTLTQCGAEL